MLGLASRFRSIYALFAVSGSLSLTPACGARNLASSLAGTPTIDTQGQARCGVMKSQRRPLIIEWPSSDRGALEGLVKDVKVKGLVAVRYEGCEMEIVRRCVVGGRYAYTGVEPKRDDQMFRNADELYAKIPIGAAQLEAELSRSRALALEMTVIGHYAAEREPVARNELRGDCDRATHVITMLTVGAFQLSSEASAEISGGARLGAVGPAAGAGSSAERAVLRSDGDPQSCRGGYPSPPEGCGALLRLEVEEILEPDDIAATRKLRPCPRGTVRVDGGRFSPAGGPGEATVSDFCLDLDEVSVNDYAKCAEDGPCSAASTSVDGVGMDKKERTTQSALCNGDRRSRGRHPINCVTWHQAEAYCRSRDARLPSSEEWEWAARGGDQERSYPWGEQEPGPRMVNACDRDCARHFTKATGKPWSSLYKEDTDHATSTAKLGTYARGAGRGRLNDLAGNVWEWTSPRDTPPPVEAEGPPGDYFRPNHDAAPLANEQAESSADSGSQVIRGGSFMSATDEELRVTARAVRNVKDRRADLGFRCARDP